MRRCNVYAAQFGETTVFIPEQKVRLKAVSPIYTEMIMALETGERWPR
jgi:hypothetical protein